MGLPRVLVIDDTPAVSATVRLLLEGLCDVTIAANAAEAVAAITGTRFEAVLCDLYLPDASVEELATRLGQADPGLISHLVLMSGAIDDPLPGMFGQVPPNRRLRKPFSLEELLPALADAGAMAQVT